MELAPPAARLGHVAALAALARLCTANNATAGLARGLPFSPKKHLAINPSVYPGQSFPMPRITPPSARAQRSALTTFAGKLMSLPAFFVRSYVLWEGVK